MSVCAIPAAGWSCSRAAGHDGPCAAIPTPGNLSLLLADCRQALFDAIKVDAGASVATRFEVGRAVGLMARAIDNVSVLLEAGEQFIPGGIAIGNGNVPDDLVIPLDVTIGELRKLEAAIAKARGQ